MACFETGQQLHCTECTVMHSWRCRAALMGSHTQGTPECVFVVRASCLWEKVHSAAGKVLTGHRHAQAPSGLCFLNQERPGKASHRHVLNNMPAPVPAPACPCTVPVSLPHTFCPLLAQAPSPRPCCLLLAYPQAVEAALARTSLLKTQLEGDGGALLTQQQRDEYGGLGLP